MPKANKFDELNLLYHRTCDSFSDEEQWKAFLRTAGHNFRLRFDEQVLLFAQRPDATAVLEYEKWTARFNRPVKRGANGIGVFTDTGDRRVKYYFDIADTFERAGSRPVPIWEARQEHFESIEKALAETYGFEIPMLVQTAISQSSTILARELFDDDTPFGTEAESDNERLKAFIAGSAAYMCVERLGVSTEEYPLPLDTSFLSDRDTLSSVGSSVQYIAAQILSVSSRAISNYEKNVNRTSDKEENVVYNIDTHKSERSANNASNEERIHGTNSRKAAEIPERVETGGLQRADESRDLEGALQGDAETMPQSDRGSNERDSGGERNNEGTSAQRLVGIRSGQSEREQSSPTAGIEGDNFHLTDNLLGDSVQSVEQEQVLSPYAEYKKLKEKYSKKIVLVQEGDFFNSYADGASVLHSIRELDITPTQKLVDGEYIAVVGITWKSLNQLIGQLNNRGFDVVVAFRFPDGRDFKVEEHDAEQVMLFNLTAFERKIPYAMRCKSAGAIDDGADTTEYYWVTQTEFGVDDLKAFQEAVKKYGGEYDTFHVTVRDLSPSYTYEQDVANDVLATVTADKIVAEPYFRGIHEMRMDFYGSVLNRGSFEYKGLHFEPVGAPIIGTSQGYIEANTVSGESLVPDYSLYDFFKVAAAYGDVFYRCEENGKIVYPCEKELLEYVGKYTPLEDIANEKLPNFDGKLETREQVASESDPVVEQHKITEDLNELDEPDYYEQLRISEQERAEEIVQLPIVDYRISDLHPGHKPPLDRAKENLEAIKTLLLIENENRTATSEEQEILAKFVGWGGLSWVFDESGGGAYQQIREELKSLVSEEDYASMRASTLDSFYTPPAIASAMYDALQNLGFTSGRILEPSMGIGAFFGTMPEDMYRNSDVYGVELDNITGRIARLLYPSADITVAGFETTTQKNYYDVVIGKGVPRDEIKFIHESDTEAKKEKLFEAVRNGKVRILLGSTFLSSAYEPE